MQYSDRPSTTNSINPVQSHIMIHEPHANLKVEDTMRPPMTIIDKSPNDKACQECGYVLHAGYINRSEQSELRFPSGPVRVVAQHFVIGRTHLTCVWYVPLTVPRMRKAVCVVLKYVPRRWNSRCSIFRQCTIVSSAGYFNPR